MSRYQPALLGGLFIGVLSGLPLLGVCCCLWAICGGVLVTYLAQSGKPEPVETGEVVLAGLLAGILGAIIASFAFIAISGMTGASMEQSLREALDQTGNISPETRDQILSWVNSRTFGLLLFVINVPVYAVLSMLGALLGLAFFRKKTPPQPPPPQVLG